MIPQGPLEGDHMANGRVDMAVREVNRQCRTLRISAEHCTGVRIADDSPLLSWLFCSASHEQAEKWQRRKDEAVIHACVRVITWPTVVWKWL